MHITKLLHTVSLCGFGLVNVRETFENVRGDRNEKCLCLGQLKEHMIRWRNVVILFHV